MLKFFRRIRRQLLSENQFTKYSLYAAGEIFLVVVGILIALQVNNWNERIKSFELQKENLLLVKDEMTSNLDALLKEKQRLGGVLDKQRQIIALFDSLPAEMNEQEFSHLIAGATNYSTGFHNENGALTELISTGGLKGIINQRIRNTLASWEGKINRVRKQEEDVDRQFDKLNDYIEKYGDFKTIFDDTGTHHWVKVDRSANNRSNKPLLKKQEFENIFMITLANGYFLETGIYAEFETALQELIQMIDEELY
jgi:hypothetical protein